MSGEACSIASCGGRVVARGLCEPHYRADRRERDRLHYQNDPEYRARAKANSREQYRRQKEARGGLPRAGAPEWKKRRRAKIYGLTSAELDAMLEAQGGRCAVCRELPSFGFSLCVDHCHATNKVRGLLCIRCNRGLGLLRDDTRILADAIAYLERSR